MYSIAINNNEVVIKQSLRVDAGDPWAVAKLNPEAQRLERYTLEEVDVPTLKYIGF